MQVNSTEKVGKMHRDSPGKRAQESRIDEVGEGDGKRPRKRAKAEVIQDSYDSRDPY